MNIENFNFDLPVELIARYPLAKRSASRLLCLDKQYGSIKHRNFNDVIDLVTQNDLLIFNNTKVIPARLFGNKVTGGRIEVLVERILDKHRIMVQLRASKAPKVGDKIKFTDDIEFEVGARTQQFYELHYFAPHHSILEIIESIGQIPLPHYMHRSPELSDIERYQTIYAKEKGSVAAPTAGLHFDEELFEKLRAKNIKSGYLTLHIGAGTFLPVRDQDITKHKMHAEYFKISPTLCEQIIATKAQGGRIIAVGTTTLRALETASSSGQINAYEGDTDIFIYPGYVYRCVDALITNLHLPRSSLLMLVCALGGHQAVMSAYQSAIANAYRFYSYGDAMWIA